MSMTIAVTRNLPSRFNGFLASCMLELAPGVYVGPHLIKGVRDRVWNVMMEWSGLIPEEGGVILVWKDKSAPSGLGIRMLGWPKKEFLELNGLWLTVGAITGADDVVELKVLAEKGENGKEDEKT